MPKLIMLELTPDDMMKAIITLSEMMVSLREFPNLIKAIPRDPQVLGLTVLSEIVKAREQSEKNQGVTPEEDAADEEQLEQSVKAFQDLMTKAQSK